ncbi:unnamed protein product [Adineta steineri]|uniref:G-protein coupled receptors family 1 profile domain-containing protein n=1 Tax=Adineta steineri TaxID=433720 RepID=A0A816BLB4_9BILA|nr:unnamed protein product [Adineta steineri]
MNNTATARPITNATISSSSDHLYSFFVNPVSVVLFYQIGYPITFLLGFLGNVLSLITFSRSTLRKISTGLIIMMLILIDIVISVRIRKRTVIQPTQTLRENNKANQQRDIQLQMFILTLTSISIFLITTLPISVYKITAPSEALLFVSSFYQVVTVWTGLGWFQSLNYAMNFYIHCLTSRLFRKEFKQQMKFICGRKQTRVNAIELNKRAQHPQVNQQ